MLIAFRDKKFHKFFIFKFLIYKRLKRKANAKLNLHSFTKDTMEFEEIFFLNK